MNVIVHLNDVILEVLGMKLTEFISSCLCIQKSGHKKLVNNVEEESGAIFMEVQFTGCESGLGFISNGIDEALIHHLGVLVCSEIGAMSIMSNAGSLDLIGCILSIVFNQIEGVWAHSERENNMSRRIRASLGIVADVSQEQVKIFNFACKQSQGSATGLK